MVELFSGLPPGHEFFAQYSFIRQEDLPQFEAILQRAKDLGLKELDETERRALISLPFKLIGARHRLGLIDESFEARVVEARRYFAANLPADLKRSIAFFDAAAYNTAASLQDNILFGKIVTAQAEAGTRITALVRELLDELGLRPLVVTIGLDYQVGVGGARLPVTDRQKIALVRALIKQPALLIIDQALAPLDPASQQRVLDGILTERKGRGVAWVLSRPDLAERFNVVLVMERGKLAEKGAFAELKSNGGPLHKLLVAA
jgi:ABC-type transport system involved in cytochrome bd biosynthesis fused ATPase/permease subunit